MSSILATFAKKLFVAPGQAWAALQKSPHLQAVRGLSSKQRLVLGSVFMVLVSAAAHVVVSPAFEVQACPAQVQLVAKQQRPVLPIGPISSLRRAKQSQGASMGHPWTQQAAAHLEECAKWKPVSDMVMPMLTELEAQMQCHNAILDGFSHEGSTSSEAYLTSGVSTEKAVEHVGLILDTVRGILRNSQDVETQLRKLRGQRRPAGAAPQRPVDVRAIAAIATAFGSLVALESPAREALQTLQRISERDDLALDGSALQNAASVRLSLRSSVVEAVKVARAVADTLPRSPKPSTWFGRASNCKPVPAALAGIERLAIVEASMEMDAEVLFNSGLLMSHAAMAPNDVPVFGDSAKDIALGLNLTAATVVSLGNVSDASAANVPPALLLAEALLKRGFAASRGTDDENKKASSYAGVLAYHGKFLMELGDGWEDAAEQRYRLAAGIASEHERDKLAAHSLAQLSYFLWMHGRPEDALPAAEEAVGIDAGDPLAVHLRATLRLSTGAIRTHEAALAAKNELAAIKGRLPNQRLESDRAAAHGVLSKWLPVARASSFHVCLTLGDVADILSCVAAKLAYA
eukprot:TRINITY_DN2499_c0_g3_i2.p1 TRINITY_DN2499_c0_g3~~TRINITY_DN2499_c0_g3_i2.p1  ORF type:complete len:576 (+),score=120.62 TRINITY_DN2499_c0_g3_i2:99-1826(+)